MSSVWSDPRLTLAEILARSGRADEAREAAERSLRRYKATDSVSLIEKVRALLAEIPV